jgi:hypothetical protein
MEIRPLGPEFFQVDGQVDMTKLTAAVRDFANAPEKLSLSITEYIKRIRNYTMFIGKRSLWVLVHSKITYEVNSFRSISLEYRILELNLLKSVFANDNMLQCSGYVIVQWICYSAVNIS